MRVSSRTVVFAVALVAAPLLVVTRTFTQTDPSDAAEVRLQLADLMFAEGRFLDARDAYNAAKATGDLRLRRRALSGAATTSLHLAEFSDAAEDADALIELSPRDAEAVALQGDTLWALGRFLDSDRRFDEALAIDGESARARHGHARSLASRGRLEEALNEGQAALRLSPRDAEIHYTVGSIY